MKWLLKDFPTLGGGDVGTRGGDTWGKGGGRKSRKLVKSEIRIIITKSRKKVANQIIKEFDVGEVIFAVKPQSGLCGGNNVFFSRGYKKKKRED